MKKTKKILYLFIIPFLLIGINTNAQNEQISNDPNVIEKGQGLFENNCTQCHSIGGGTVVGPDLKDVHTRRSVEWIKKFITNSQALIKSGDEDAVKIYNEFNQTEMLSHDFSDEELNSLVAYLKFKSENQQKATESNATASSDSNGTQGEATASDESGKTIEYILMAIVVILVLLLIVLLLLKKVLVSVLKRKSDLSSSDIEMINQRMSISYLWEAKWIKGLVLIVVVACGLKVGVDFMFGIGIQKGYAPTQPINYSHKLHAGSKDDGGHEIDCNYCHTGVTKSKHANIPSPNICLNCHSEIKKESPEIQKLYKAVETGKPIEWIRIHNLQDFVYFSHAQHVKVGGVTCQECHGPVETMDVVYQYSDLTMGWCVNCHKDTPLNTKGNGYYDELVKKHNALKGEKTPFTVQDNGGWECAKCHY